MYNASNNNSPVCYDLWDSPYVVLRNGYEYRFSSVKHLEKFNREVEKREQWLSDSLSRRFKVPISAKHLANVQWYMMCEGRGFAVSSSDGVEWDSPNEFEMFVEVSYYG